jgi:hypothetical protein
MANLGSYFDEIDQTGYLDMISQPPFFGTANIFVLNFSFQAGSTLLILTPKNGPFLNLFCQKYLYSTYQQICSSPIFFIL